MIKRLLILLILLVAVPCWGFDINTTNCDDSDATTFCIQTSELIVDGGANASGKGRCNDSYTTYYGANFTVCDSGDTLYIEGSVSARGQLQLLNFDGAGEYITVTNDPTAEAPRAYLSAGGAGALYIKDCKYLNVTGNANSAYTYGIYIVNTTATTGVKVLTKSDHIKLGYLEITQSDPNSGSRNGIAVTDVNTTESWVYDTFEIHHNYIHDVSYTGMYLGHNKPHLGVDDDCAGDDCPYTKDFSIHDNLFEDIGSYALNLKGVEAGSTANYIYDNIIRPSDRTSGGGYSTGLVYDADPRVAGTYLVWAGIRPKHLYAGAQVQVYGNWVEKTRGIGIEIMSENVLVYDNTVLNCGDNEWFYTQAGIGIEKNNLDGEAAQTPQIYDNIIVESVGYGIIGLDNVDSLGYLQRNIITESTVGERWGGGLTEGTGANANVYQADTDSICFTTWSDDSDYSNDDFTLCCDYDYTSIAANACGATTTPVSGVKFSGAKLN